MVLQRRFSAELKILTAAKMGKKCDVPFLNPQELIN